MCHKNLIRLRRVFKKNLKASKLSEHPPSGEKLSKDLGGNIGCRVVLNTFMWRFSFCRYADDEIQEISLDFYPYYCRSLEPS